MKRKKSISASCLLAALAMSFCRAAAEDKFDMDPKYQLPKPDTKAADLKKPVKVFILMGQSNMFGMGGVGPVTTKATLEWRS